jgi:hypothetical protein
MGSRSFSNLGLRGTSKVGRLRVLSLSEMLMKVAVGLGVSSAFFPGDIGKKQVTDADTVETSSADMFPFVGAVPEHDGQWIAAGFAGHGKSDPTIQNLIRKNVLTDFLPQACPEFSSQQLTSHPLSSSPSVSATASQLLPLRILLYRSLSRSRRRESRSCKGQILPRGRCLLGSGTARVVARSSAEIRGGCLMLP